MTCKPSSGFCPQVTAPIMFTLGYICPDLRDALTIDATGTTTRTGSAKIQVRQALTMTTDQVSPYTFSTAQYFSLFCSFCSGVLSLQATLCLCNRTIKNAWDAEAVCRRILYWGETVDLITKRLRMFGGILSCNVNTLLHQLFIDIAHIMSM